MAAVERSSIIEPHSAGMWPFLPRHSRRSHTFEQTSANAECALNPALSLCANTLHPDVGWRLPENSGRPKKKKKKKKNSNNASCININAPSDF